jgi:hypothetical protein
MTTSVWPSDAIASADANGNIVKSVPRVTLDDANKRLTANSPAVATRTVARPRESRCLDPLGTASFDSAEPVICAPGVT